MTDKESFCLHFDGKKSVELNIKHSEIRLAAASCESSSANDIFKAISEVLTEYNEWHTIKMIVSDMTAVITGKVNEVFV